MCKGSFQEYCQEAKVGQIVFIGRLLTDSKEKEAAVVCNRHPRVHSQISPEGIFTADHILPTSRFPFPLHNE